MSAGKGRYVCENCGAETLSDFTPIRCKSCKGTAFYKVHPNDSWVRKNRKTEKYIG